MHVNDELRLLQDVAKGVTKVAIREARAQDLRNEILNSERLVFPPIFELYI